MTPQYVRTDFGSIVAMDVNTGMEHVHVIYVLDDSKSDRQIPAGWFAAPTEQDGNSLLGSVIDTLSELVIAITDENAPTSASLISAEVRNDDPGDRIITVWQP